MKQKVSCPICHAIAVFDHSNPYRPFCSHRCQLIDLGEWFNEERKISIQKSDVGQSNQTSDHEQD